MMLRALTPDDTQRILDFAYRRERENLFVIKSLERDKNPFEQNHLVGYFAGDELQGVGTFFGRFGNLGVNAETADIVEEIVTSFADVQSSIRTVAAFRQHAVPTVKRLRKMGLHPKSLSEQTVYVLRQGALVDHSSSQVRRATEEDIDDMIRLSRCVNGRDPGHEISPQERSMVSIQYEFILKTQGTFVAKGNIHGCSLHYAQIGGVMTHPGFRSKGFAKNVVSAICRHWVAEGKDMLLFCDNGNAPAISAYRKLGFQPVGEFLIAEY